jgi:hypothetical protein
LAVDWIEPADRVGDRQKPTREDVEPLRRFDGWQKVADLPSNAASRAEKLFNAINGAFGGVPHKV